MPTSFFATEFSVIEQDDVLIVTLGATPTKGDAHYLMLQLGLAPTPQDTQLGQDVPHLEFSTQVWSWYGEIERFELFRHRVVATMSPKAAQRMQNDGVIGADFDLNADRFAELQRALYRIFHGRSCFIAHP